MFDLKVINSVLAELEAERGIPAEKMIEAIEMALAAAYKKEYGKRGQIVRANFDKEAGDLEFNQIKIVVDDTLVRPEEEDEDGDEVRAEGDDRPRFNPEHHIYIDNARMIKKDVELDDELEFALEGKDDFGRIAAQTAKQVVMQKLREAEKVSILEEYGEREGEIVVGNVQRFERGSLYVDLGRTVGVLQYEDQIPGERYRQGERIRSLLYHVDDSPRGTFLKLTRASGDFLIKLFETESPELAAGTIEIKKVAREAGSRSKLAVVTNDDHIDPVGALVGQRGVRVSTVTSELGGEKIDIIEWSDDTEEFIESALSPAEIIGMELNEDEKHVRVEVAEDQQSLAIGRGGQNVRLAAKLTEWKIDIHSAGDDKTDEDDNETTETPKQEEPTDADTETEDIASEAPESTNEEDKENSTKEDAEPEVKEESAEKEEVEKPKKTK